MTARHHGGGRPTNERLLAHADALRQAAADGVWADAHTGERHVLEAAARRAWVRAAARLRALAQAETEGAR